jgi:DNA primase
MSKKVLGDMPFFEEEGDIIDRVTREHEYLEEQKKKEEEEKKSLKLLVSDLEEKKNHHRVTEGTEKEEEKREVFEIDLNTITGHYHEMFYVNDKAIDYLKSKGIANPEFMTAFQIGFCDGRLKKKLSKTQMTILHKKGFLREDFTETFEGCLVFPLFDGNEQVINICFLNTADDSEQYLYPDKPGIFNHKASRSYPDQLILTETVLDALSLLQLGFNNVQSLMKNPTAFTESHIQHLKDNNVRNVITAFQSNEFSIEASKILKELLLFNQIDVKTIYPPKPHNSWVTAVNSGFSKEELVKQIEEASLISQEKKEESFTVRDEKLNTVFIINGITYRIAGLKDLFVNNLKVKISAEMGDDYFPDTVDLCSSRSRMSYSNILAGRFNVEPRRIENDLIKILRYQEDKRDNVLNPDKDRVEMTEDEIRTGTEFLKDPGLIDQIIEDITTLGYVGDDLNKLLIYLCASSRKLDDPISVIVTSQSAGGKSFMVETVSRLIPPEDVFEFDTGSDQALQYTGDRLMNKFLVMGEDKHNEKIEHQLREILSRHRVTRWIASKDEKTGEIISRQVIMEATLANVISTTSDTIHPENATRYFIITTDESRKQTDNIYESQKNKYSENREEKRRLVIPPIINKHHAAQRLLKKMVIIMSEGFRNAIRFPNHLMRFRRDHMRFLDLIACICYLRQYQKDVRNNGQFEYIECDSIDYEIAHKILIRTVMASTGNDIARQAVVLYDEVRSLIQEKAEKAGLKILETGITQREIREETGFNQMYVKRYLRTLTDYEYLKKTGTGARGTKGEYYLVMNASIKNIDLSMIASPEAIKKLFENEKSGLVVS